MTIPSLNRRLARLEERLRGDDDYADWLTGAEARVVADLRRDKAISAEARALAQRALHVVAAERHAAGLPPPQHGNGWRPVPPEVVELMERARRELELTADWDRCRESTSDAT